MDHARDPSAQAVIDAEHLRLLAIGYVFSGVMTLLFSMFGLFYAGVGLLMQRFLAEAASSPQAGGQVPPEELGLIVATAGVVVFLFTLALAIAKFMTASCLRKRRARLFCQVMAGISCLGIPYGTFLGVCSFMVLGRASVAALFDSGTPAAPA